MLKTVCLAVWVVTVFSNQYGVPNNPQVYPFYNGVQYTGYHPTWYSDSSSDEKNRCELCRPIRRSCDHEENCIRPRIEYFNDKGCRKAVVSCPTKKMADLKTADGEMLMNGGNGDKVVRCNKNKRWIAKKNKGNDVGFKTLLCVINVDEE